MRRENAMSNLKRQIRVTMALGLLSLLGGLAGHLALTDIYHDQGRVDVSLEWNILRVCALIFLLFIGLALVALGRALKAMPERPSR
jgi:hypothetical protein